MFILNESGTIALNYDYVLYTQCENDSDRLRENELLYSGNHYALTLHFGDEHDGKILRFYGSESLDNVEERNASILLSYNNGLRLYDFAEAPDQYTKTELSGPEPGAYWILSQNPAQSVNLKKCSQVRIVDITDKYRLEHPVSKECCYALVASYNKQCGYKKVNLFAAKDLNEAKAALNVLMYSYASGRKMLDYSGYATTVFERYEDYKSVKDEFGIA